MFTYDHFAREASELLLSDKAKLKDFKPAAKVFICLPLEHHEDINSQKTCLKLLEELYDSILKDNNTQNEVEVNFIKNSIEYSKKHVDIIEKFGRFPHRNRILVRVPTKVEIEYLNSGGETFGTSIN